MSAPMSVPGARSARARSIYTSVLEAVTEQRLPPGSKLTEEQLGSIFAAGRTTVRSALQALAHDQIVTLAPHRSAFVSAPTVESARDIFVSRKLIEVAIAREVAVRASRPQLARLRTMLEAEHAALERADRATAIRLSGGFHVAVAATRGEGVLTAFVRGLVSQSSLVVALYGRRHAPPCRYGEHIAFVRALEERDSETAARVMADHLDCLLGDLDLSDRSQPPVDIAAVLRIGSPPRPAEKAAAP